MPTKQKKVSKKKKIKQIKSKKKVIEKKPDLEKEIQEGSPESSLGEETDEINESEFIETPTIDDSSAPSLRKILTQEPFDESNIIPQTSETFSTTPDESKRGIYTSSGDSKYSKDVVSEDQENKYTETPKPDFATPTRFEEQRATGLAQEINPLDMNPHQALKQQNEPQNNPFTEVEKKYKENKF